LIPLNYNDFDWQDNIYLEKFLCNKTRAIYKEEYLFDSIGRGVWTESKIFKFDCKITYFANDKFRLLHFAPVRDDAKAEFVNSAPEYGGALSLNDTELKTVNYVRSSIYSQSLEIKLDKELEGIRSYNYMFHSTELANQTRYNGWNFSETYFWDDYFYPDNFWYSTNTTILAKTVVYTIGVQ
jgi:hypothetical protein